MPTRLLTPVADAAGEAVLVQGTLGPVYRGHGDEDYVCGHCKGVVLASHVAEGEMWDLVFRCGGCGGLSTGPRLPEGTPLGRPLVAVDPGEFMMKTPVTGAPGVVLAGKSAVERRSLETGGYDDAARFVPTGAPSQKLVLADAAGLQAMIDRAVALLGVDYERLRASDERGKKSATSPRERHRLIELIDRLEQSAASMATDEGYIDASAVAELSLALDLFDRWRNDPAVPPMVASLKASSTFAHTVITFAAASLLTDLGNGTGFQAERETRTADLWVSVGSLGRLLIEVKAPYALRESNDPLNLEDAQRIVAKALKKAGTGKAHQLTARHPGMLLIGGFHLPAQSLDVLEQAAKILVASTAKHVVAIAILGINITIVDAVQDEGGSVMATGGTQFVPTITIRVQPNPRYAGDIRLLTD